jgi:hypothetical protein
MLPSVRVDRVGPSTEAGRAQFTGRRPRCSPSTTNGRGWQRSRDPRCFSASDALSLGLAAQVEVQPPARRVVELRSSWGSFQEADDDSLDSAPPPPPRASQQPLKINTDLRLVGGTVCVRGGEQHGRGHRAAAAAARPLGAFGGQGAATRPAT